MSQGIVGLEFQCLLVVGNRLVPGLLARELNRGAPIGLSGLRKARRCNRQHQKKESPHRLQPSTVSGGRTLHDNGGRKVSRRGLAASPVAISASPDKLRADLPDTHGTRAGDGSKTRVADIAARVIELHMVEYVEELTPNLERLAFRDGDRLLQP